MPVKKGKSANINGKFFECLIAEYLKDKGYKEIGNNEPPVREKHFIQQDSRFLTLYNKPWRMDFFVYHPEKWPNYVAIEVKWQEVGGSTDHKFPYVVFGMKRMSCPTMLLLGGGAYSPHSLKWLMEQQTEQFIPIEFDTLSIEKWLQKYF